MHFKWKAFLSLWKKLSKVKLKHPGKAQINMLILSTFKVLSLSLEVTEHMVIYFPLAIILTMLVEMINKCLEWSFHHSFNVKYTSIKTSLFSFRDHFVIPGAIIIFIKCGKWGWSRETNDGLICSNFVFTVTNLMFLYGHYVISLSDRVFFHKNDNIPSEL